jgi:hypothetical protein
MQINLIEKTKEMILYLVEKVKLSKLAVSLFWKCTILDKCDYMFEISAQVERPDLKAECFYLLQFRNVFF